MPPSRFHAHQPTRCAAGAGIVTEVGRYAAAYGRRALIVTGQTHAQSSGLLATITAALRDAGLDTEVLEGVSANPSTVVVDAGATLARAWRAELIVAVGGGSVIDVAKAIATSAAAEDGGRPFREHLSGIRAASLLVTAALPVVAVPTLPGSGSETNGTSVITDAESGRKLSAHTDLAAPRLAVIDPQLAAGAGVDLVGSGLVDGFCHALEAALSTRASVASDALAEQALRMLLRHGADAVGDGGEQGAGDADALLAAWWATNLAGQALTLAGSIVTHPLAHPLSARFDVRHGNAVAALEHAVVARLADRFVEAGSLQKVAGWLDVRGADADDGGEAALRGVLTRLARLCGALGVRESVTELGVPADRFNEVVRDARASGSRGLASVPGGEPTADELFAILDLAAAVGPTATAKRLLAAARDT